MKINIKIPFKRIKNFITALIIVTFATFAAIIAVFFLLNLNNLRLYIIRSGSMSPVLPTGSIIITDSKKNTNIISPIPNASFEEGEIITYTKGKETITHRIAQVENINGQIAYHTKGDANKGVDLAKVEEQQIIGKVIWNLPEIGYAMAFARSSKGYTYLIAVPIAILIYSEILNIRNEVKKLISRRKNQSLAT